MQQQELIQEFTTAFTQLQQELGFSASLEDLDEAFHFTELIIQMKFVSPQLANALCSRMRDKFNSWTGLLHGWLYPNPSSLISASESNVFSEEDKERITTIVDNFMAFTSRNLLLSLKPTREEQKAYFDDALIVWETNKDTIYLLCEKINVYWSNEAKSKASPE